MLPTSSKVQCETALRILIVDDNRDAASSLAMLLRMMGNDVRTAFDGVEAVKTAADFEPHAAVIDISLPRMNGFDAARHMRRQPWGRRMVLIAATGWSQESDRKQSEQAGFDHHLIKPVEPSVIIGLLGSLPQANESTKGDGTWACPICR